MFEKLPKVYHMPNIPQYTKEDAEAFANTHFDRPITREVKFGHIWENRKSFALVPLEEGQLKIWTWGRIACVGDCVHKMTPNMGAGGNTAIEYASSSWNMWLCCLLTCCRSAAALANELRKMADQAEKSRPSFGTVTKHLRNYQALREERVSAVVAAANGLTRVHALKTWLDKLFAWWILPFSGDS